MQRLSPNTPADRRGTKRTAPLIFTAVHAGNGSPLLLRFRRGEDHTGGRRGDSPRRRYDIGDLCGWAKITRMLALGLHDDCEMSPAANPICPLCGCVVPDGICDFLYSPRETPSLDTATDKVIRYECDCGYKFVVVAYESQRTVDEPSHKDSDAKWS